MDSLSALYQLDDLTGILRKESLALGVHLHGILMKAKDNEGSGELKVSDSDMDVVMLEMERCKTALSDVIHFTLPKKPFLAAIFKRVLPQDYSQRALVDVWEDVKEKLGKLGSLDARFSELIADNDTKKMTRDKMMTLDQFIAELMLQTSPLANSFMVFYRKTGLYPRHLH